MARSRCECGSSSRAGRPAIEAHLLLSAVPASAGAARRFVDVTLTGWGCDAMVDTVVLLVSEVVTNAILHARSDIEVRVTNRGAVLRIEVSDHGDGEPVIRSYGDDASSGRGLAIVEQVASDWGVTKVAGGKLVWFEVAA